jgi:predicted phosphodiesterase
VQAILSDVHGNLEALTAVLADLERHGVNSVYNLGDTLGVELANGSISTPRNAHTAFR